MTRHVWEASRERIDAHRLSLHGKALYARRKETVERSFADCKELHGHRYARMRGLSKVYEQCLLCAAVFNMKKIALHMSRQGRKLPTAPVAALLKAAGQMIFRQILPKIASYAEI